MNNTFHQAKKGCTFQFPYLLPGAAHPPLPISRVRRDSIHPPGWMAGRRATPPKGYPRLFPVGLFPLRAQARSFFYCRAGKPDPSRPRPETAPAARPRPGWGGGFRDFFPARLLTIRDGIDKVNLSLWLVFFPCSWPQVNRKFRSCPKTPKKPNAPPGTRPAGKSTARWPPTGRPSAPGSANAVRTRTAAPPRCGPASAPRVPARRAIRSLRPAAPSRLFTGLPFPGRPFFV